MNNAEKFLQVFGFDLPIKYYCGCWDDKDRVKKCRYCTSKPACYKWATADYTGGDNEQ